MPALSNDPKPSRAEQRLARVQSARLAAKTVAKSVAHQGVTARPMDKNLSRILDMKRAQMRAGGTSVKRLGVTPAEAAAASEKAVVDPTAGTDERKALLAANSEAEATKKSTSVERLHTPEKDLHLQKRPPTPEPPDMAI